MKTEYDIKNMSCNHCVGAVKKALEALPDVTEVTVTVGHAAIESTRALTRDELNKALDEEGYSLA